MRTDAAESNTRESGEDRSQKHFVEEQSVSSRQSAIVKARNLVLVVIATLAVRCPYMCQFFASSLYIREASQYDTNDTQLATVSFIPTKKVFSMPNSAMIVMAYRYNRPWNSEQLYYFGDLPTHHGPQQGDTVATNNYAAAAKVFWPPLFWMHLQIQTSEIFSYSNVSKRPVSRFLVTASETGVTFWNAFGPVMGTHSVTHGNQKASHIIKFGVLIDITVYRYEYFYTVTVLRCFKVLYKSHSKSRTSVACKVRHLTRSGSVHPRFFLKKVTYQLQESGILVLRRANPGWRK